MSEKDFTTIYANDGSNEQSKYWLYILLLEMNDDFMSDVAALRKKYDINFDTPVDDISDIDPKLHALVDHKKFMGEVRSIAHRIKLQGNWVDGLALYVLGYVPQASLFPDNDLHRVEAKAVTDADEPHVLLKVYGDMTENDLQESVKGIRRYIVSNMGYENTKELKQDTLLKMLTVHRLRKENKNFRSIAEELDDIGYDLQAYSDVRRQYSGYKKLADRLY